MVKILQCFAAAFRRVPKLPGSTRPGGMLNTEKGMMTVKNNEQVYSFEAFLEMKEEDNKVRNFPNIHGIICLSKGILLEERDVN